jgi:hypothetical protein
MFILQMIPKVLVQESWCKKNKQVRFEFTSSNIAKRLLPCLITQQRKQKFQNAGPVAILGTPPDYSETKESWIPARRSLNGISLVYLPVIF